MAWLGWSMLTEVVKVLLYLQITLQDSKGGIALCSEGLGLVKWLRTTSLQEFSDRDLLHNAHGTFPPFCTLLLPQWQMFGCRIQPSFGLEALQLWGVSQDGRHVNKRERMLNNALPIRNPALLWVPNDPSAFFPGFCHSHAHQKHKSPGQGQHLKWPSIKHWPWLGSQSAQLCAEHHVSSSWPTKHKGMQPIKDIWWYASLWFYMGVILLTEIVLKIMLCSGVETET